LPDVDDAIHFAAHLGIARSDDDVAGAAATRRRAMPWITAA
jgi:hypothetical protein